MIIKNLKIYRALTLGVLIIVIFIYTINIQPAVFGSITSFFQTVDNNNIINDMSLRLYEEFPSFNKIFSNLIYNNDTPPNMILKTNKEVRYEFFTYIINDNAGFVLQFSYFYNLLANKPEFIVKI